MSAASEALSALHRCGDGGDGAWSEPQAAVLIEAPTAARATDFLTLAAEAAASAHVANWAVVTPSPWPPRATILLDHAPAHELLDTLETSTRSLAALVKHGSVLVVARRGKGPSTDDDAEAASGGGDATGTRRVVAGTATCTPGSAGSGSAGSGTATGGGGSSAAAGEGPALGSSARLAEALRGALVILEGAHYEGGVEGLDDGSPSTVGVGGAYAGGWDHMAGQPEGRGVMRWSNGIVYEGLWRGGKYHGYGSKSYSRGGGYSGMWREVRSPGGSNLPAPRLAVSLTRIRVV